MRLVSLLPSATDIIFELGLIDSLVGVSQDCNWPPEVLGKPIVSRSLIDPGSLTNAEINAVVSEAKAGGRSLYAIDAQLLSELGPELVILQDVCEVCSVSSGDLTTACPIGAEVYSMNPHTLEDVVRSVGELAGRLGVPERGLEVQRRMRSEVQEVRSAVATAPRPRVFVAEWTDPPYTAGHWVPEMVRAAGGVEVLANAGAPSFPTTWEAVLESKPDLVVIAACGLSLEESLERTADLRLPVRTVVVDGDAYFSRPAPRLVDGVRQLGHLVHPGLVPDPALPEVEFAAVRR